MYKSNGQSNPAYALASSFTSSLPRSFSVVTLVTHIEIPTPPTVSTYRLVQTTAPDPSERPFQRPPRPPSWSSHDTSYKSETARDLQASLHEPCLQTARSAT
ncbi:hypothetical protein BDV95DRAFT_173233 [Massariosphaeria phaeospora]|uniref:Uncharacterized protein n=1 Tax=Massariosphaeria phaeospora TaxID=100035 RepID=A0A7C8M3W4_9PLEO|nr:hypothetical protein BDV95DRAFT_173233 [Massariosphaeria phaeospora]